MLPYTAEPSVGQYCEHLVYEQWVGNVIYYVRWSKLHTFMYSTRPVNITIVRHSCSQIIRQKSAIVPGSGPYVMLVTRTGHFSQ